MPADPDRRVGVLHGEGFAGDIGVLVEAAIEARGRLGPELLEYGNPLIGHRAARIEGWAVQRLEFFLQPAGADAKVSRPPDRTSSEATTFAVSTGLREATPRREVTSRSRSVAPATTPRMEKVSSASPTL